MQIGVTIPTYQRAPALTQTLAHLATCTPGPHEVLIHIDAGDTDSAAAIAASPFADTASVIHASTRQGPGGGRNRLMAAANTPWVLSLDDDSYPLDKHFFTEAAAAIDAAPDAAVIATRITHQGELAPPPVAYASPAANFVNCGALINVQAFRATRGYLPLPLAYGAEEVDLALQLLDGGRHIVRDDRLRVFHATDRSHHATAAVSAASVRNLLLLGFVRYPKRLWPVAGMQALNRIMWLLRNGRTRGIFQGLLSTPSALWKHRDSRAPVRAEAVRAYRALSRQLI